MTVEERVRRIEQWLASRDTAEMMRLQADIRVSLHTPFPDSPEDTAHLSFREQLALQLMRNHPMISLDAMMARIRAIDAAVDAPRDEPTALLEAERDSLRDQRDAEQRRAMAAESESDVLRAERDSLRAQLADAHRVPAQGETIDAATERDAAEKMERLERGVREAENAIRGVASFYSPTHKCWCLDNPRNDCHLEYCLAARAWLQEFGS